MPLLQEKGSVRRALLSATLLIIAGGASGTAHAQSESIDLRPPAAATSEGDAALFAVTLPAAAAGVVSVTYTVRATLAGGVSIGDFASPTSAGVARAGTLPFRGELEVDTAVTRTGFIVIPIYDDEDSEKAESFLVDLGAGVVATATIAASDPITISGMVIDGDLASALGERSEFLYFVELDSGRATAASTLMLAWEITADALGPQGARGVEVGDFASSAENVEVARVGTFPITGTIVIPPGGASGDFFLPVFDDDEVEPLEFFRFALVGVAAGDDDGAYYKIGATSAALAYVAASDRELGVEGPAADAVREGDRLDFAFALSEASADVGQDLTVHFVITGSGVGADDFGDEAGNPLESLPTTVIIAAGGRVAGLRLHARNDGAPEGDEQLDVRIERVTGGGAHTNNVSTAAASATISDYNRPLRIAPPPPVDEDAGDDAVFVVAAPDGAVGVVAVTYTVAATGARGVQIEDFADTADSGAVRAGALPFSGMLMVDAADTRTGVVTIPIYDDAVSERAETFTVTLHNGASATVTIRASDPITLEISPDEYVTEGAEFTFIVYPSGGVAASTLTLVWEITGDGDAVQGARGIEVGDLAASEDGATARAGSFPVTGTLVMPPGRSLADLVVATFDDERVEPLESLRVAVTEVAHGDDDVAYYQIGPASAALAYIFASDREISVRAARAAAAEGGYVDFTFALSEASADLFSDVTLHIEISGTGITAGDFADDSGAPLAVLPTTATIRAGARAATLRLRARADGEIEAAEEFRVRLRRATGGGGGGNTNHVAAAASSASATISPNDPIEVSVEEATVAEESGAALSWRIQVGDGATPVGSTLTVHWMIVAAPGAAGARAATIGDLADPDDAAVARAGDFPIIGRTIIAPRTAAGAVAVRVFDDAEFEPAEALRIAVTGVFGASDDPAYYGVGAQGAAFGYIISGDREITVRAARAATAAEGGSLTFVFALSEGSAALTRDLTAHFAIIGAGVTADDFEDVSGDPLAALPATAVIAANETSTTLTLRVRDDDDPEEAERFQVALRAATGGGGPYANNLSAAAADAIIAGSDRRVRMSRRPVAAAEGSSAVFTVLLPDDAAGTYNISYTVNAAPGSAGRSLAQFSTSTLGREAGTTPTNTGVRNLSDETGISIEDFAHPTTTADVARTGTLPFSGVITVDAAAAAVGTIHVPITDDDEFEPRSREIFQVALTQVVDGGGESRAPGAPSSGVGVIINDDGSRIRRMSVDRARVLEGESMRFTFGFQNQLSLPQTLVEEPPGSNVYVAQFPDEFLHYEITGTGITAADFARNARGEPLASLRGRLRAGRVTSRFNLWTNIDGEREGAETFRFIVTAITDGSLPLPGETLPGDSSRVATILPSPATIAPPVTAVAEGESAALTVAVAAAARTEIPYKVAAAGVGGGRQDFQILETEFPLPFGFFERLPLTYRTAANEGRGAIRFLAVDDVVPEQEESFVVFLSETSATVTIRASDPVEIALDAEVAGQEGDVFLFPITASTAPASTLTVTWAITTAVAAGGADAAAVGDFADATGSAARRGDFPIAGSAAINAGTDTGVVAVATFEDDDVEPRESFRVILTDVEGGIGQRLSTRNSALGYILPSDREVGVQAPATAAASEGQSLDFTFGLSGASAPLTGDLTLHFAITGSGIAAGDFEDEAGNPLAALPTTVSIAAGRTAGVLTLRLRDDGLLELTETFGITLRRAAGGGDAHANHVSAGARSANGAIRQENTVVAAHVYLQGAYDENTGYLKTNLTRDLPRRQPYGVAPWNYPATTTVPFVASQFNLRGTTMTLVDWVLVELRASTPGAGAAAALSSAPPEGARAAGLLLRDGRIAGINEDAPTPGATLSLHGVFMDTELPQGRDVYVLIHHRNHLSVMSARAATGIACEVDYCADFRARPAYAGCAQLRRADGAYVMVAGDVNRSGVVSWGDDDLILDYQGRAAYTPRGSGYLVDGDLNFDRQVSLDDVRIILDNDLLSSQCVPRR